MPTTLGLIEPRHRWRLGVILASLAGILLVLAVFLSIEVQNNLRRVNSANSDTMQWTLGQIEVEMLELSNAIAIASLDDRSNLDNVRLEFDIIYSRIQTLALSPVYKRMSKAEAFQASLDNLRTFLNQSIPLIDGPDNALRAALPDLRGKTQELRLDARKLAVVGLGQFVEQSDELRQSVTTTLFRLAGLAVMLVAALMALVVYMLTIYRQARNRGTALTQANQRMNTILTTSLDGVIVSDRSGRIMEFNAAAQKVFGLSSSEARAARITDLFLSADTEDAPSGEKALPPPAELRAIVGRGRIKLLGKRASGHLFPAEIAIQSAYDGERELYVAFFRDISRRVSDEQELVQARDSALAGEKAKSDFLTVMSHEIRTPLNGLLGTLSLLEDTPLSQAQAQFVRNMAISGKVLTRHVDSVLDLARIEAGVATFSKLRTDLDMLVQDAIDGQNSLAESNGTQLSWSWIGPPLRWIRTDPTGLEQVLLNLISNAIKFTPGGKVTIELEATQNANTAELEFRVIDTGLGIPEQDLEMVFRDFVTRDVSFGRQTGGTGLGLGISRRIVEAMGGEIGVESTLGVGSVFWFRLPVTVAEMQAPHTEDKHHSAAQPLDILLVEDNEINREVASEMLHREGHSVTCAADGIAGVELANNQRFDVILMDISMPVLDGFQATKCIRNGNGASRNSVVIAFSANVMPKDPDEITSAGMNGFLSKPLSRKKLTGALARISSGDPILPVGPPPMTGLLDEPHFKATLETLGRDRLLGLMTRFHTELDMIVQSGTGSGPDPNSLQRLANDCHKAAASASVFGATGLRSALLAVERSARVGNLALVRDDLGALLTVWQTTRSAMSALVD